MDLNQHVHHDLRICVSINVRQDHPQPLSGHCPAPLSALWQVVLKPTPDRIQKNGKPHKTVSGGESLSPPRRPAGPRRPPSWHSDQSDPGPPSEAPSGQ
eukprot:124669-Hanusia_phi.AAC.1